MRSLVYFSLSLLTLIACSRSGNADCQTNCNYSKPDSSWFVSVGENERVKICGVKYYVNGDTLFTTQKYSALTLSYSLDADSCFLYRQIVMFDEKQIQSPDGWYHIILNRDDIWREPDTHLSSVVLHRFNDNPEGYKESKAFLFEETHKDSFYNRLSPQLTKLYPVIK